MFTDFVCKKLKKPIECFNQLNEYVLYYKADRLYCVFFGVSYAQVRRTYWDYVSDRAFYSPARFANICSGYSPGPYNITSGSQEILSYYNSLLVLPLT